MDTEEVRFSKNTIRLAEAIYHCVNVLYTSGYATVHPSLVLVVKEVISGYDKHTLIQGFIENSHVNCWDNIKDRNEVFFVENASDIFKHLPSGEVNLFKDLFTTKDKNGSCVIDQNFKEQIWKLFDAMVKISIKYIHKNRGPHEFKESGTLSKKYTRSFFDNIDINNHSIKWNVTLEFQPQL